MLRNFLIILFQICDSETKTPAKLKDVELDMYADDFVDQEKKKLDEPETSSNSAEASEHSEGPAQLMWEYKLKQDDKKIEGPHSTEQMQRFVEDGKFKTSVWVRKIGQDQFYSSNRIDFELYLS